MDKFDKMFAWLLTPSNMNTARYRLIRGFILRFANPAVKQQFLEAEKAAKEDPSTQNQD